MMIFGVRRPGTALDFFGFLDWPPQAKRRQAAARNGNPKEQKAVPGPRSPRAVPGLRTPKISKRFVALLLLCAAPCHAEEIQQTAFVGRSVSYDPVVLDGPELIPKPIDDNTTVVVRIKEVYPHGSAFRYSFEAYGLEPGSFNVLDYLQRSDGSVLAGLPAITLQVQPTLPAGQVEPQPLTSGRSPPLGGYRLALLLGGLAWIAGLIWLVRWGRKPASDEVQQTARPITTADRLRPLVKDALDGQLDSNQRAMLERLLLRHWRERLALTEMEPLEALSALSEHEEAGQLLRSLEDWLHRPDPSQAVDVEALLKPYADVASLGATPGETTETPSSEESIAS